MVYKIDNTASPYTPTPNVEWRQKDSVVRLLCETNSGAITIDLPEISTLQGFWDTTIIVNDFDANASGNNITINAGGSDIIDATGTTSLTISGDGESVTLTIANGTSWISTESV